MRGVPSGSTRNRRVRVKRAKGRTGSPELTGVSGSGDDMHSPMEQFEIKRLLAFHIGSLDASFTNSALWMLIAVALATVVFVFGMSRKAMVPGRLQSAAELGYEFIAGMVRDNVGSAGK